MVNLSFFLETIDLLYCMIVYLPCRSKVSTMLHPLSSLGSLATLDRRSYHEHCLRACKPFRCIKMSRSPKVPTSWVYREDTKNLFGSPTGPKPQGTSLIRDEE